MNFTSKVAHKKTSQSTKKPNLKWIYLLVVVFITAGIYAPSLNHDFTNLDDPGYVTENALIQKLDAQSVETLFNLETFVMGNYHPITMLSLAWDYDRFGVKSSRGFHLMNLVYHLLASIALYFFILELTGIPLVAGITALVFGIHPMHVESVAWVASRKDQLYALFFFLSLWSYVKYVKVNNPIWIVAAFVAFLASLLSKAMAAPLPVVLLLTDFWMKRKWGAVQLLEKVPFFALAVYFGLLAIDAQDASSAIGNVFSLQQKLLFALSSFWLYVVKFFVPYKLGVLYPYPDLVNDSLPAMFYVRALLSLGLLAAVGASMRRTRTLAFGVGFFGLMLALVLQIISVGQAIMADRYTYLPYVGLTLMLALGVNEVLANQSLKKWKNIVLGGGILFLVGWGFTARARVDVWSDTITLFTDQIEKYPNVGLAYNNRGKFYAANLGKMDLAFADLSKGIEVDPDYPNSYLNRGNIFGLRGDHDRALQDYNRALELDAKYHDAYLNRAITYSIKGQYERALEDFARAEQLGKKPSIYINRAYCRLSAGDYQGSVADYTTYLSFDPQNGAAYYYRSQAYRALGNASMAQRDAEAAKSLGFGQQR